MKTNTVQGGVLRENWLLKGVMMVDLKIDPQMQRAEDTHINMCVPVDMEMGSQADINGLKNQHFTHLLYLSHCY